MNENTLAHDAGHARHKRAWLVQRSRPEIAFDRFALLRLLDLGSNKRKQLLVWWFPVNGV